MRDHDNGERGIAMAIDDGKRVSAIQPLIYLSGPISGCTPEEARGWRRRAEQLLSPLGTLDPCRRNYQWSVLDPHLANAIVAGDKEDIDRSTMLLVHVDRPSVGTAMEVHYAAMRGIPRILVNRAGGSWLLSAWYVHHATAIHDTLEAACESIRASLLVPR